MSGVQILLISVDVNIMHCCMPLKKLTLSVVHRATVAVLMANSSCWPMMYVLHVLLLALCATNCEIFLFIDIHS